MLTRRILRYATRVQVCHRIEKWFWGALAVLVAVALLPIWGVRLLPFLDLPNHLATIAVWHRLGDSTWNYQKYYLPSSGIFPYLGYYLPTHLLAYLFSVETANKVYLTLYALALVASVLGFARYFGRSHFLTLLCVPFILNYNLMFGFISCAGGVPLLFVGIIALDRLLVQASWQRSLQLLLVTLGMYFMHVLCYVVFGLCAAGILLVAAPRSIRRAAWAAFVLGITLLLVAWNYQDAAAKHRLLAAGPLHFSATWQPFVQTACESWRRLLIYWPGRTIVFVLGGLFTSWLLLQVSTRWRSRGGNGSVDSSAAFVQHSPEICLGICLLAYLSLPFSLQEPLHWWNVGPRACVLVALLGILSIRGRICGAWRFLLIPAVLVELVYPAAMWRQFAEFNQRASGCLRLLEKIPRGQTVLTLMLGSRSDTAIAAEVEPYVEFPAYAQLLVGGYNHVGFRANFPFRIRPGFLLPAPHFARPQEFRPTVHGRYYDYLVTYQESTDGEILGQPHTEAPLLAQDGNWRLYSLEGFH